MKNGKLKVLSLVLCLSMATGFAKTKIDITKPKAEVEKQLKSTRKSEVENQSEVDAWVLKENITDVKVLEALYAPELLVVTQAQLDDAAALKALVEANTESAFDKDSVTKIKAKNKDLVFKAEPAVPADSTIESISKHLKAHMWTYIICGSVVVAGVAAYAYKKYCDKQQNSEEEQDSNDFAQ